MTSRSSRIPNWVLALGLFLAIVVACGDDTRPERSSAPVQRSAAQRMTISKRWLTARVQPGHVAHVTKKQLPCDACHDLSGADPELAGSFDHPRPDRCTGCHEAEGRIQHALGASAANLGPGSPSNCMDCHRFTDRSATSMPPADVLHAQRSHVSGGLDAGSERTTADAWLQCQKCHGLAAGSDRSLGAHRFAECAGCHTPHGEQVAKPSPCTECHQQIQLTHGASHGSVQADCMTCHQKMHASKAHAVSTCQDCHDGLTPMLSSSALWADGHASCADCHQAHDFSKAAATACRTCHQEVPEALASARVEQHSQCTNCHQAHDVRSDPSSSCESCHQQLGNDHPTAPGATSCGTCHPAHPDKQLAMVQPTTLPCRGCHEDSLAEGASHAQSLACTACHAPHQFQLRKTDTALCQRCHAPQATLVTATVGHAQCVSCHAANIHSRNLDARSCDSCHQRQAERVVLGHSQCTNCHEPHSGARQLGCATCHDLQKRTAPAGHQDCGQCHDAHSAEQKPGAACRDCHQAQATALHHDIAGGCGNCHRPHAPRGPAAPPPCTSCHQVAQLPALHRVAKHTDCSQCHSGHQLRVGVERDTCLSCHVAQRTNHFPDAERCSGCHLFDAL